MKIVRSILACALFTFAVGCGNSESSDDTTEGELGAEAADATRNVHLAEVSKCLRAYNKASERAVGVEPVTQTLVTYGDCLKKANDGAVARIEQNLAENQSTSKGKTARTVAAYRTASEALCVESVKASPSFGGTMARTEAAACRMKRERFLATAMDAYAWLGDEAAEIEEGRDLHPTCYRKFDKRIDGAVATHDMAQVAGELSDCVARRVAVLATIIAKMQVENNPSEGSADAVALRIKSVSDAVIQQGKPLCQLLNEAGENGGGSLSTVAASFCAARVSESVFSELRSQIEGDI